MPLRWAFLFVAGIAAGQEIRPGVRVAGPADLLPLPTTGFEVYLVGEAHGFEENQTFAIRYLKQLHRATGLRDVVIEEDAVYEEAAQAYVDGRAAALPQSLCLRAGVLHEIRRINSGVPSAKTIRVHLTDIDSPAGAIRQHLLQIATRLKAPTIASPGDLRKLAKDPRTLSELRTIELSLLANRDGLEVDIGPSKGSPYLESREQAIADNISDLVRKRGITSLLVLYGADHVSRSPRKDGGPNRDQPFEPMALRLRDAGIKAYSLVTFPLTGRSWWRGRASDLPFTPADGHLSSGETLDRILAAAPNAPMLFIDRKTEQARLPSQDVSRMEVDAFVLFRSGAPMRNFCGVQ